MPSGCTVKAERNLREFWAFTLETAAFISKLDYLT
jgi:hypothetical protein